MTKIKNFSLKRPVLFSVAVCCVVYLCMRVFGALTKLLPDGPMWDILDSGIHIAWPVALSLLLGFRFIYSGKGFGSTLKAGAAVLAFYIFTIVVSIMEVIFVTKAQWQTPMVIVAGIFTMLDIGIREEVVFRGIIGNCLAVKYGTDRKGLMRTLLISALLFGGVHVTNIFHGVELMGLVAQIIGCFASGLLFMAIYLRGGNIWVLALLHAITDANGLFKSTFIVSNLTDIDQVSNLNFVGAIMLVGIDIALALFLLRKSKQPEIFARLEKLRAQYSQPAESL